MHHSFFDSDTPGEFPAYPRKNKEYHVSFRGRKPVAPSPHRKKRTAAKNFAEWTGSHKMGRMKKHHWMLIAMMTAEGGEREGGFELFIGS
jgi:hypothetical protein